MIQRNAMYAPPRERELLSVHFGGSRRQQVRRAVNHAYPVGYRVPGERRPVLLLSLHFGFTKEMRKLPLQPPIFCMWGKFATCPQPPDAHASCRPWHPRPIPLASMAWTAVASFPRGAWIRSLLQGAGAV